MSKTKNTGISVQAPKKACEDKKCPFHGALKVRGKTFTGTVIADKMQNSVVVEWNGIRYMPKYERYKKTRTRVAAHNPKCIDAKEGDLVLISECRPLSKTKNFVILEVKGKAKIYEVKKQAVEEAKHKITDKEEANKAKAKAAEASKEK